MSNPFYARYVPPKASLVIGSGENVSSPFHKQKDTSFRAVESSNLKLKDGLAVAEDPAEVKGGILDSGLAPSEEHTKTRKRGSKKIKGKSNGPGSPKFENNLGEDFSSKEAISDNAANIESKNVEKGKSGKNDTLKRLKRKRTDEKGDELNGNHEEEILRKHSNIMAKFGKSMKRSEKEDHAPNSTTEAEQEPIINQLEPLPQPKHPEQPLPIFSALPKWLANPVNITTTTKCTFEQYEVASEILERLRHNGYTRPSAVQAAVLPLLLPTEHQHPGDLCVSAPTGSGKTLAYVLPMIQSLMPRRSTKLRAVIIVPTRELVNQVYQVMEDFIPGTYLRIGISSGNIPFRQEQHSLIRMDWRYDPQGHQKLRKKAGFKIHNDDRKRDDDPKATEVFASFAQADVADSDDELEYDIEFREMVLNLRPGYVPAYLSTCDVLICTPGRLVDHIKSTKGFDLTELEWLIIDEADRLLDQSFQEWTKVLLESLKTKSRVINDSIGPDIWLPEMLKTSSRSKMRKIVLSATMTRDLEKLQLLNFKFPKLVLIGTDKIAAESQHSKPSDNFEEAMVLPSALQEWAVPVGDGSEKPLYVLDLLQNIIFIANKKRIHSAEQQSRQRSESLTSSSDDDSYSSLETFSSSSSASTALSTSSLENTEDISNAKHSEKQSTKEVTQNSEQLPAATDSQMSRTVLIFVNSNENATRLSRLLAILHPPYAHRLGTLKKGPTSKSGLKLLDSLRKGHISILVASDRASRGLDIPNLTDVINYDMPRSVSSYVHRVGRTARAQKHGESWTFFTDTEAGWFWNQVARTPVIGRGNKSVGRRKLVVNGHSEQINTSYEKALRQLEKDVKGTRNK